jgi:hypothetical protein
MIEVVRHVANKARVANETTKHLTSGTVSPRDTNALQTLTIDSSVCLPMDSSNGDASLAEGPTTKQTKTKTKQKAPPKPPKPLPTSIAEITIDDASCLVVDQKPAPAGEEDEEGTICDVLVAVKPRDGTGEAISVESLDAIQIRKLAMNVGINMASYNRRWKNLRELAIAAATYKDLNNHRSSLGSNEMNENGEDEVLLASDQMRLNTVLRLGNVLFSEKHVNDFLTLNDARDHLVLSVCHQQLEEWMGSRTTCWSRPR